MKFNATFNNISVILWRSVLLMEEKTTTYTIYVHYAKIENPYFTRQRNRDLIHKASVN